MIEKAKKHKKGSISEEDIATVLRRYTATTVLALLQEVAHCTDVKIDWNALVERTSTGITNPREYQMLWRHLAYRGAFLDKIEDEAQPLDDDSDLEYELEAFPAVSSEASTEATACVKVLLASGLPSDSSLPNGPTVEAPLTINIPNFQSSRALESLQPPCSMQGMNITVPVSVQKQPAPSGTVAEGSDASGPASSSMFPRRRRKPWSEAEDMELISAVQKCGEGNWANILKGDFKGDRTAAQLSQRWAIIRKRHGNLNTGGSSTGTQLSEAQLAARHAVSLALNMPVKNLTANAIGSGTNATSNLAGINATSNLARANATSNSAGANVTNNSVGTNATGNSAGMNAASNSLRPTFSSESSVAGSSSSFAQAQKQSQQSVVAAKPSPAGSLGCAAKSRIITKKPSVKSVSNSDATVRAMAKMALYKNISFKFLTPLSLWTFFLNEFLTNIADCFRFLTKTRKITRKVFSLSPTLKTLSLTLSKSLRQSLPVFLYFFFLLLFLVVFFFSCLIFSMFPRKQTPPIPLTERINNNSNNNNNINKHYDSSKNKEPHFFNFPLSNTHLRYTAILSLFLFAWFLVVLFWFPPTTTTTTTDNVANQSLQNPQKSQQNHPENPPAPTCSKSFLFYVHNLPPEFNTGLLKDCRHLNIYTDMCPHVANCGLGQPLSDMDSDSPTSWFATHQFIAEMIFHARMENHPCRTLNPHIADLFYVPFYAGLHASSKFRESNLTERDALAVGLVDYLQDQQWWKRSRGKDHFMALGRTAWDFMRTADTPDFGANCLLNLPAVKNMTVLTVERQPWKGSNQYGVPYPSYFHPSSFQEVVTWQNKVRRLERSHLFSFIGAPRKGLEKAAIRDEMMKQCAGSTRCELLQCRFDGGGRNKCHEPGEVLGVMSRSEFCLQAPGDSFTRRSTFDSVLAGCIPVFFSPHTAYTQYAWFFPEDAMTYSVFIDEKSEASKRIEEELLKIPRKTVEKMRENVIGLIPRMTYAHPNATDIGFDDAVDVALTALAQHVRTQ